MQQGDSRLSRHVVVALLVIVLALALVLTFACILRSGPAKLVGRYDVYRYFGPLSYFLDYCIHHGEFPLWNPLTYCGEPFAANPQTALFYPPNLIRSLLTFGPTPARTHAGLIALMGLHLLLAAFGTYALAGDHGVSRIGALGAALAFTFSALMVRRVCEYHFVYTMNWLPLLLFLAKRVMDTTDLRRKLAYALGAGLAFGLSILGGFLQIVLYVGVSLLAYALLYRLFFPRRKEKGLEGRALKTCCIDAGLIVLVCMIGLVVAAALLWPALELMGFTAREKGEAVGFYSNLRNLPAKTLFQNLIVYPGMKYESEALRGSGAIALLLAVTALLIPRRRDVGMFFALYLVLVDCSFGPPLPISRLVSLFTPFAVSAYSRAYDLALLPLSILAGFGLDAVAASLRSRWSRALRTIVIAGLSALLLVFLWRWAYPSYLPVSALVVIIPCAAAAIALIAGWIPGRTVWLGILAALLFAETLAWNRHYVPYLAIHSNAGRRDRLYPGAKEFWPDNHRRVHRIPNRHEYALEGVVNGYEPLHLDRVRDLISGGSRARRYHRLVTSTETTRNNNRTGLLLKRSFWLARQYVIGPLPPKDASFPPTTTVFLDEAPDALLPSATLESVLGRAASEDVEVLWRADEATLAKWLRPLPGKKNGFSIKPPVVTTAGRHAVVRLEYTSTQAGSARFTFRNPARGESISGADAAIRGAPGSPVLLERPLPDFDQVEITVNAEPRTNQGEIRLVGVQVLVDQSDEDALIRIASRRANRVELEVGELPDSRFLVFLDAAYPGWKAYVDGEPTPVLPANDAFKAIALPPGAHRVEFVFRPRRVHAGLSVSLVGLAAIVGVGLSLRRKRTPTRPKGS